MRIIPIKGNITRFCTSQSDLTAINAFNKPGNFTGFVAEGILGNSNKDYQLSVSITNKMVQEDITCFMINFCLQR